jgi:two-component system OmpR family response regulator
MPMSESGPDVVVVDDDPEIRELLAAYLRRHGCTVREAADGSALDALLAQRPPEVVVLDIMMPGEDGLAICRRLRAGSTLPIILLTALAEDTDRIVGLELGADDYLTKPFNPRELLARIRAVLRRAATPAVAAPARDAKRSYRFAGWTLDPERRELRDPTGVLVALTGGEFDLLHVLLQSPGIVLSRDQLLDRTRGRIAGPFDRAIDVQLSRLRRKIEADPKNPVLIKTVRTGGYVLAVPVERR